GRLARTQLFELLQDLTVIGHGSLRLVDLRLELAVRTLPQLQLLGELPVPHEEACHLGKQQHQDHRHPELAALLSLDATWLRQQVDPDHARTSRSLRSARPSATGSCAARVWSSAASMNLPSTVTFSIGDQTSTAMRARRSIAWPSAARLAVPPVTKMREISASPLVAMKKSRLRWISAAIESQTASMISTTCCG